MLVAQFFPSVFFVSHKLFSDYGGGLVIVWGLCCTNLQLYSFVADYEWSLLVKTTDT